MGRGGVGRRMGLRQGHRFQNRGSETYLLIASPRQLLLLGSHGFWTPHIALLGPPLQLPSWPCWGTA